MGQVMSIPFQITFPPRESCNPGPHFSSPQIYLIICTIICWSMIPCTHRIQFALQSSLKILKLISTSHGPSPSTRGAKLAQKIDYPSPLGLLHYSRLAQPVSRPCLAKLLTESVEPTQHQSNRVMHYDPTCSQSTSQEQGCLTLHIQSCLASCTKHRAGLSPRQVMLLPWASQI